MPSLINNPGNVAREGAVANALSTNYRKSAPSTRFGTPELISLLITISNIDASDVNVVDGNFYNLVSKVQRFAEVYAVGAPQYGEGGTSVTFVLKAGTVTDPNFSNTGSYDPVNDKSVTLQVELQNHFSQSVNTSYTTLYGLSYL